MLERLSLRGFAVAVLLTASIAPSAQQAAPPIPGQRPMPPPTADATLPMPAILKQYSPVSAERLENPADGEWPMIRRTYDGWGYSPLTQIDAGNAARLQLVWGLSTGVTNGHESAPLVVNGVMILSTPGNQVLAID